MNNTSSRSIAVLGKVARLARRYGLTTGLDAARNLLDAGFMKIGRPPLMVRVGNQRLYGYLRHRSFLASLAHGKYEPFSSELYESAVKKSNLVVDGGAHIGLYTLMAAKHLRPNGRVLAFEADPYNFQALLYNIKRNRLRNVTPIQKALSDTQGTVTFYQSPGTIGNSLVNRKDVGARRELTLESTNLDNELKNIAADSLVVKLDVEGAEPRVLLGSQATFKRIKSVVVFAEINPAALRDAGQSPEKMVATLDTLGFQTDIIDEPGRQRIPAKNHSLDQKGNLYCEKIG